MIDKFAGYGFNKSHAAGYALIAYQTAWLKAHHPVEFYAASMCFDIHVRPTSSPSSSTTCGGWASPACRPSINASEAEFSVEAAGRRPRRPLRARRAQGRRREGDGATGRGAPARTARSPSLDDFAARIDPRLLNRRQIESLAGGGAFDGLAERWAVVRRGRDDPRRRRQRRRGADQRAGRPVRRGARQCRADPHADAARTWSLAQRMAAEKESFGFYFSAHPVDNYRHLAEAHGARRFADLAALPAPADGGRSGAVMAAWSRTRAGAPRPRAAAT